MTLDEACSLLADMTLTVSDARGENATIAAERDTFRLIAVMAFHHAHDLHVELVRLKASHLHLLEQFRALRVGRAT